MCVDDDEEEVITTTKPSKVQEKPKPQPVYQTKDVSMQDESKHENPESDQRKPIYYLIACFV